MKEGMVTLADGCHEKIFRGITSVEEVLRAIISEADERRKDKMPIYQYKGIRQNWKGN